MKRLLHALTLFIVFAGLGLASLLLPEEGRVARWNYCFLHRSLPPAPPKNVVVITVPEPQSSDDPEGLSAALRGLYGDLLEKLRADGAAAAVFDIFFGGAKDPQADQKFADALNDFGKAILAAKLDSVSRGGAASVAASAPYSLFAENAAQVATSELSFDASLMVKRHPWSPSRRQNILMESLSAAAHSVSLGAAASPHDGWVRYYGKAETFATMPLEDALNEKAGFFRDKTVFIGYAPRPTTGQAVYGRFANPYGGDMTEAELQATLFQNLADGTVIAPRPKAREAAIYLVAALVLAVLATSDRLVVAALGAALFAVAAHAFSLRQFAGGQMVLSFSLIAMTALALLSAAAWRLWKPRLDSAK